MPNQYIDGEREKQKDKRLVRLLAISRHNIRPLLLLGVGVVQAAMFAQVVILTIWVSKLTRKPAPTLVELRDGTSITVEARDPLARSPENIKNFTGATLTQLFSWSSVLPDESTGNVSIDKGVPVSGKGVGGLRVPTPTYEASFALSESFRSTFVKKLAELVPRTVFRGDTRTLLTITRISEPVETEPGSWKLDVVASLITFSERDRVGKSIPFNKTVYVRAVYPQSFSRSEDDTARLVARIRGRGLEIYRITDLRLP